MCGIAGKLLFDPAARAHRDELAAMLGTILHRGPDGRGFHLDGALGLAHCRLSIIDVAGGAQPLANEDGTVHVVFNGEIYNFPALREELLVRGHVLRTHSDTEVIVHLYEEFGPDCVQRLDGMFAFALWDARRRRLLLARDRVGIKPLYYAALGDRICFASEIKALLGDPAVPRDLDSAALRQFLAFYYLPGEATLFRSIRKLLPGHVLIVESGQVRARPYWDLGFTDARAHLGFEAAVEELQTLLRDTVRSHLLADVPVGVLLSGGVDSSAVLSFAATSCARPIKTFTVGFEGNGVVDERPYARLAALRFGSDHHELTIGAQDFWDFLPAYSRHMEEPVCEPPAVALYHVTRLARRHVKVLLSGEGGDEAFAGYPNYRHQLRLAHLAQRLHALSRPVGSLTAVAGEWFGSDRLLRYGTALGRPLAASYFSRTSSPAAFFNRCERQLLTVPSRGRAGEFVSDLLSAVGDRGRLDQMLYVDTKTWLPDDLLIKADKMTMANSLELRVPLLDHHVLEFAASLPASFKIAGRETKRILKAAFAPVLPAEILHRPKAGFPVPYDAWLRGPLADGVRETLLSSRALGRGYFRRPALERLLDAHRRQGRYAKEIFSLLALEFWHRAFVDPPGPSSTPAEVAVPSQAVA